MNGFGSSVDIRDEAAALLVGQINDLADIFLVSNDAPSGMALFLEQDELADIEFTDLDAERCEQFSALAVAAVLSDNCRFHDNISICYDSRFFSENLL